MSMWNKSDGFEKHFIWRVLFGLVCHHVVWSLMPVILKTWFVYKGKLFWKLTLYVFINVRRTKFSWTQEVTYIWRHGGAVVPTVVSQQKGPGSSSWVEKALMCGICIFSPMSVWVPFRVLWLPPQSKTCLLGLIPFSALDQKLMKIWIWSQTVQNSCLLLRVKWREQISLYVTKKISSIFWKRKKKIVQ